jgi:hypothetical protein
MAAGNKFCTAGFDKSPAALQAMLDNNNGRFLNPAVQSTAARRSIECFHSYNKKKEKTI